jgi:hydroxymethylpyrimidine pyrophosphatase-like HAD family hydrolase
MYCRVLACDFDGTGAIDGRLSPEVAEALGAARERGIATLLVTGRVLEALAIAKVDLTAFDAVVAENGAVVRLPRRDQTLRIAEPPPERLLTALREKGIPFHAGSVVIGTWEQHAADLLHMVRRLGLDQQLASIAPR